MRLSPRSAGASSRSAFSALAATRPPLIRLVAHPLLSVLANVTSMAGGAAVPAPYADEAAQTDDVGGFDKASTRALSRGPVKEPPCPSIDVVSTPHLALTSCLRCAPFSADWAGIVAGSG